MLQLLPWMSSPWVPITTHVAAFHAKIPCLSCDVRERDGLVVSPRISGGPREKKLTTHHLARDEAIVRADEHVLLAAEVDAARLEPGGILKGRDQLLHLLGGHLRG